MTQAPPDSAAPASFEDWANIYTQLKAFSHPSELHGGLCGRLAAGARLSDQQWHEVASEQIGVPCHTLEASDIVKDFLQSAYQETLQQLQAADMSFRPLLPDDEYDIDQRVQSLACWVRGFLEGMAVTASGSLGAASQELREVIEDFVAISQVSDAEGEGEESEQQLMEIAEYVRMGALSVFTEFNPPSKQGQPTLH